ncbi:MULTISPECIES: GNAT family N-acetyltransferase [unclassified Parabacteroides]|uniref:GNAT family N-acetyltransferase n=1 Tax=unclassified Parabacteroides TaxID=2649774 RepID=UPI002473522E|nr:MULTISPECIES: GNAT family N-acetyltransferase [unclassified Parabacteroides]
MTVKQIKENKKDYLEGERRKEKGARNRKEISFSPSPFSFLLVPCSRYLEEGDLFALYDEDLKAVCVVAHIDNDVCELKNIAVYPQFHRQGYGRALISYVSTLYTGYKTMLVGTGETPSILSFYRQCGFEVSHRIKNFFTDHYDHPIVEEGVRLVDMVYLRKKLGGSGF